MRPVPEALETSQPSTLAGRPPGQPAAVTSEKEPVKHHAAHLKNAKIFMNACNPREAVAARVTYLRPRTRGWPGSIDESVGSWMYKAPGAAVLLTQPASPLLTLSSFG